MSVMYNNKLALDMDVLHICDFKVTKKYANIMS